MMFFSFKPVDTLLFKGAESANKGQDHISSSIFPPFPQTISGAIRTSYLKQKSISFKNYNSGKIDDSIVNNIGKSGEKAPFTVIGPFFKQNNEYFIPAPYNWYIEKEEVNNKSLEFKIIKSQKIESSLIACKNQILWAKGKGELMSIGGKWISLNDLYSSNSKVKVYPIEQFASFEQRTGIQLEENYRAVKEGHLFSFYHSRLKDNVEMIFGLDKEIDFDKKGILTLGAEQRFGNYIKIENNLFKEFEEKNSNYYMSLSVIKGDNKSNSSVIATGKINYIGGWDLSKKFHKEMEGYFPAGTVFNCKINNNCIKI